MSSSFDLEEPSKAMSRIAGAILRGKGAFSLVEPLQPPALGSLCVGASKVVGVQGGYIVVIGLDRENLSILRDACTKLLGDEGAS